LERYFDIQDFPHQYKVTAQAGPEGDVSVSGERLPTIASAPPVEFGGPGDRWSPESLLVASVADCFILSFRACARASKLDWVSLGCEVEGTLERVDRRTAFTAFTVHAHLRVPPGSDEERARKVLQKAEDTCLITNSLTAPTHLEAVISEDE